MNVLETALPGVLVIEPRVFPDSRGHFFESWNERRYAPFNLPTQFVQDNVSLSKRGVLRGMHFQQPSPQGKLVHVLRGEVFDVAADVRLGSPTFGKWVGVLISESNHRQLWVPAGFAHGFCVTSDEAVFMYKCTDYYNPATERTIRWDDAQLAIEWPVANPIVSDKDQEGLRLSEFPRDRLPVMPPPIRAAG